MSLESFSSLDAADYVMILVVTAGPQIIMFREDDLLHTAEKIISFFSPRANQLLLASSSALALFE